MRKAATVEMANDKRSSVRRHNGHLVSVLRAVCGDWDSCDDLVFKDELIALLERHLREVSLTQCQTGAETHQRQSIAHLASVVADLVGAAGGRVAQ